LTKIFRMATKKQQNKISKVMREFYAGKLTTHGNKVTDVSQAKAIALSEAGFSNKKSSAKKKMAEGGVVISEYDDEKYMSKRHYLRDTIESFFGKQNVYFNSADWGGMPVWTVKGDLYEGTFIVMGDEDDVILMTRRFDSELGEDVNNTLMQVEWQDINGLNDLLNTAMIIKNSGSKMAEGGSVDSEGIDLFEDYDNIPDKVQKVLSKYAEAFEEGDYDGLKKASKAVEKVGYTFEYGLDGIAYDLRPIGTKGKSEMEEFAKGGKATSIPKSVIDKINEINSLIKWAEDKDNFVGGYFGGTYYEYLDFEKPIEIKNQFVYIEYNHGGGYTSFDRYNVNKKGEFDSNGLVELKSELSRILTAFRRAKKKYEKKGYFGKGGDVEKQNKEMVHSQVKEAKHHSEELSEILKEDKDIEAWVIAKMERATTDLSDVTHYLDGKNEKFAEGGGVGKEVLDEEFWKDIAHLWRSSHIDIDENGRWFNTGKYKGVNNTSGFYFTNESADLIVGLANSYKVNLSDVKRNNPDFTAFDYYKNDFEQKRNKKYANGGGVKTDDCGCDEGGVYHNPFLKSIFGI